MVFKCINIREVPREVMKTAASGLDFQSLPRDVANVNASRKHAYIILTSVNPTFI